MEALEATEVGSVEGTAEKAAGAAAMVDLVEGRVEG